MLSPTVQFYAVGALILGLLMLIAFKSQGGGRNQPGRRGRERDRWYGSGDPAGAAGWSPWADPSTTGADTSDTHFPSHHGSSHHGSSHHGSSHHGSSHHGGSSWTPDGGSSWSSDAGSSWSSDAGSSWSSDGGSSWSGWDSSS